MLNRNSKPSSQIQQFQMEKRLLLVALWVLHFSLTVYGNAEGDALIALKNSLKDPNGFMTSWNSSLFYPCMWLHITCNLDNSVVRIDLGNANLAGHLVPQLGLLPNLQYIELNNNHIIGKIPPELGNLRNLVSLDLYHNDLRGSIPASLGKLAKIRFLRLNNNKLSGPIPKSLTKDFSLQVLDLSSNNLSGVIPVNGAFSQFTPVSFQNNPHLKYPRRSPSENPPKSHGGNDGVLVT